MSITKLETSNICNTLDQSRFLELATRMKNEDKIKTDPEFAKKFMFAFDHHAEKFCVNLELLIEHEVYDRKDHAKRALTKHFTDGADYRVQLDCSSREGSENSKALRGGNNKEIIMLTPDCFKSMCLIAGSDAGKIVRQYYLDLEQVSKVYIFNELQESERLRLRAEKLHQQNLQKHRYFKFGKTGPTFYIVVSGLEYLDGIIRIKFGVAGCPRTEKCKNSHHSIDARLAEHRTLWPQLQVRFVVYTTNAQLLEQAIKVSYQDKINPGGHEIMEGVDPMKLIQTVNNYLKLLDICQTDLSYRIEEKLEMYNQIALIPIRKVVEQINNEKVEDENDEEHDEKIPEEEEKDGSVSAPQIIYNTTNITNNFNVSSSSVLEPSLDEALKLLEDLKSMTRAQLRIRLEQYKQPVSKLRENLQRNLKAYISTILAKYGYCPHRPVPKKAPRKSPAMTGNRICTICHKQLHVMEFWVKAEGKQGRDNACSGCRNEARIKRERKWNAKHFSIN